MTDFSHNKFLSFSFEKQHKKCAEQLRTLYFSPSELLLSRYNTLQEWLQEEPLLSLEEEAIADRYHTHLKKAGRFLKEPNFLPSVRRKDSTIPKADTLHISIYLDQMRSAHNVGSILRTAEAFQLGPIFFSQDTPFADHPQVKKTAMGCAEWLNCKRCESIETLPRPLIALETSPDAEPIHTFFFPETFTLAVGNEERGCSEALLKSADVLLEIPLAGRKNSLNVSNAFAIAASLASHQLRARKGITSSLTPFPCGKGDEEGQFGEVAASPNQEVIPLRTLRSLSKKTSRKKSLLWKE